MCPCAPDSALLLTSLCRSFRPNVATPKTHVLLWSTHRYVEQSNVIEEKRGLIFLDEAAPILRAKIRSEDKGQNEGAVAITPTIAVHIQMLQAHSIEGVEVERDDKQNERGTDETNERKERGRIIRTTVFN